MEVVSRFFTYAKLVVLLVGRMVAKLLRMGTSRLAEMTRRLRGLPRVALPNGDTRLLSTGKDLADGWVAVSDVDNWEPGGRNLLDDESWKRSCRASESSSTEDELIELSDGEELAAPITSLRPVQRSFCVPLPDRASAKLTSPHSATMLL
ncbi:hypothetical protein PHYPSEUDO_000333 [Phytophthora pseudosyringae]|uniref:Uncharacterized protein n=1 Tax=Phytophthora pseudosyringae TaxID=221518 RepID=A0A8T1W326_9STRA|nr:hypothetical protein PHYPSEUDO_000333 [Phytophthora pseudosyringae]